MSYEAVDYIFKVLNITILMDMMNGHYYEHEFFTSTLNANELLGIPGGFTDYCTKDIDTDTMTRFTSWGLNNCGSRRLRHSLCVFGMRDLTIWHIRMPQFSVNKMMPSLDMGAITCWHEYMYNQQHFDRTAWIDTEFYENLPYVQWNRQKNQAGFDRNLFDCKKHKREQLVKYYNIK